MIFSKTHINSRVDVNKPITDIMDRKSYNVLNNTICTVVFNNAICLVGLHSTLPVKRM